ncbi:Ribonuclease H-like [Perkinsus sp. BL_2016]|nr:Ribonuclease H-like [Perkinsus sp. BL_2016]
MVSPNSSERGPFWPIQRAAGTTGYSVKLASNFFQISCDAKEGLHSYSVSVLPELPSFTKPDQHVIQEELNKRMKLFSPFFMKGSLLYSRHHIPDTSEDFEVTCGDGSRVVVSISIANAGEELPITATSKNMSVLYEYVLDKLASFKNHQKLGNLFYNKVNRDIEKLQVVGGFSCSAGFMKDVGHYLTVDSLYRAIHRKTVLESMIQYIDSLMAEVAMEQVDVESEWRRRCENALVFAFNNGRMYRVKRVRFDVTPSTTFTLSGGKAKKGGVGSGEMSYIDFYRRFHNRIIYDPNQPMLEAVSEKKSETVLLVPELCALTGLTDEMKKDRMLMQEVLQYSRIGTGEKLNQCVAICRDLFSGNTSAPVIDTSSSLGKARHLMKEWKCTLSQVPARVEARVLDACTVSFGNKSYVVEDGNFQRWTRNGSQCPVHLTRWIIIHAEIDRQMVDMWLRSMRELGGSGFGMTFGEPMRLVLMNGGADELKRMLLDHVTADVQLVMLFTPQKDSNKLYKAFKQVTTTVRPCITQVVKSETMRKRQSIVAIVTRVVMQISAKLLGPLWHVNLDSEHTPMMSEPTMLVGIDSFENKEYPRKSVIAFVASLDAFASQYFSTTVLIDDISREEPARYCDLVAQKIRLCMHEAFEAFADSNDGILPTNIFVYRNSVSKHDMTRIGQFEVEAVLDSIKATNSETWDAEHQTTTATKTRECAYDPHLTFIMCMKHVPARFFMMGSPDGPSNPPPGTVIEHVAPGTDLYGFYLVNQHVSRGSAAPTQYVVAYDSSGFSEDAIHHLTFRLSHMYYNFPGGVRLPAPAQYAKKLAHMVATSVQADVHPRLKETLFYL